MLVWAHLIFPPSCHYLPHQVSVNFVLCWESCYIVPRWPWTHDPPFPAFQMLGLQVHITARSICLLWNTCFSLFSQSADGNYPMVDSVLWVITPCSQILQLSRSSLSTSPQRHLLYGIGREASLWTWGWVFYCWRSCLRSSHLSPRPMAQWS